MITSLQKYNRGGFTLIELSIVLVIIGLIIGGVLVGQDLVKASQLRGTIAQYEKFNAAANTFKNKFDYLPGDIPPATANTLGFFQLTGACGNPCGFGNGIIDLYAVPYEGLVFWRHLADAGMIEGGSLGRTTGHPLSAVNGNSAHGGQTNDTIYTPPTNEIQYFLIESRLKGAYWAVGQGARNNATDGSVIIPWFTDFLIDNGTGTILSPIEAYTIDQKIDDGLPNLGTVVEGGVSTTTWQATAADGYCTYGGATYYAADTNYNINPSTGGNTHECSLRLKAKF